MLQSLYRELRAELETIERAHRLRSCSCIDGPSRTHVTCGADHLISFCSNDYLGLACHPALLRATCETAERSGFGAGASRLISGTFPQHLALESDLARLVGTETALLLPSGYQANLAAITSLATHSDLVVADRALHASLIDAIRLSRAKLALYPHCDVARAKRLLATFGPRARRRFLVTESLFSMDGDVPPLPELAAIAAEHEAALLVDEAHALGALGPKGSGLCAHFGVRPDVLIGTLGKAFGSSGAFVAGDTILRPYLINRARAFLFTTAVPLPVAAAARAALDVATSPEGDELRAHLHANVTQLRTLLGLPADPIPSPILPIILGSDHLALEASGKLRDDGFLVPAIRPPTVREGTSRLRITLSARHSETDVASLARTVARLLDRAHPSSPPPPRCPPAPTPPHHRSEPIPRPHGIVIVGTDTGVGKTTVAAAILHLLTRRGLTPIPFKPVETGADPEPRDATRLLTACQRSDLPLHLVCPFPFRPPIAPAAAAAQAGVALTLPRLLGAATAAAAHGAPLVVETAGGLLSPYGEQLTSADLAAALRLPVLLVARNALGTVNHTALALAEIRRRGLPLVGVVLVDVDPSPTPDRRLNASLIAGLLGITPLGTLPYIPRPDFSRLADAIENSVELRPVLESVT